MNTKEDVLVPMKKVLDELEAVKCSLRTLMGMSIGETHHRICGFYDGALSIGYRADGVYGMQRRLNEGSAALLTDFGIADGIDLRDNPVQHAGDYRCPACDQRVALTPTGTPSVTLDDALETKTRTMQQ